MLLKPLGIRRLPLMNRVAPTRLKPEPNESDPDAVELTGRQTQREIFQELKVRELWSVPLGQGHRFSPLRLSDRSVLVTGKEGAHLIPPDGGEPKFLELGECNYSRAFECSDGRLLIPHVDCNLTVFDPKSGEIQTHKVGRASPWTVAFRQQGDQILALEYDRLLTLNPSGSEAAPPRSLEFEGASRGEGNEFLDDGRLLISGVQQKKYAFGIMSQDGELEQTFLSEIRMQRTPSGGFVVQNEGRLQVLEADGKTEAFSVEVPEGYGPKTAVAKDGSVSYMTHDRVLHYSADGELVREWQAPDGQRPYHLVATPETSYVLTGEDLPRGRRHRVHSLTSQGQKWVRDVRGGFGLAQTDSRIPVAVGHLMPLEVLDPDTGRVVSAPRKSLSGLPPFVSDGELRILTPTVDPAGQNRLTALAVEHEPLMEYLRDELAIDIEVDEDMVVIGDYALDIN